MIALNPYHVSLESSHHAQTVNYSGTRNKNSTTDATPDATTDHILPSHVASRQKQTMHIQQQQKQQPSRGVSPNVRSLYDETPLFLASREGKVEAARLLSEQPNTDINSRSLHGLTALHAAAENGHLDIVRLLLDHDADIDAQDSMGRTPLHVASQQGHRDIVRLLLEHNADILALDSGWIRARRTKTKRHPCFQRQEMGSWRLRDCYWMLAQTRITMIGRR